MIGLVACSKSKHDHGAAARDLYTSPLFRLSLAYAEAHCEIVYIASAFHGLVELDQQLDPYDVTLATMKPAARSAWGDRVAADLFKRHGSSIELLVLAGLGYINPIRAGWLGIEHAGELLVRQPLARMQIGQRLAFLSTASRSAA